jgi:hypothetical protein
MAINVFKSVTKNLTISGEVVYEAPQGFSSIVLLAQVTNVTATPGFVSMSVLTDSVETFLAYEFVIPGNDSAGMLTGKLVLEPGQRIFASSSDDSSGDLQLVMSILESQN